MAYNENIARFKYENKNREKSQRTIRREFLKSFNSTFSCINDKIYFEILSYEKKKELYNDFFYFCRKNDISPLKEKLISFFEEFKFKYLDKKTYREHKINSLLCG